jgi:hypothetical protein
MSENGKKGIDTLRQFVTGLSLPRGILNAVDNNMKNVEINEFNNVPVYIKYNW